MAKKKATKKAPAKQVRPPKTVGQILKVRRAPSVEKLEAIRNVLTEPAPHKPQAPLLQSILETRTPQQLAIEECGIWANKLLQTEEISSAVQTLTAMRRGYIIAYRELQNRVQLERERAEQRREVLPVEIEDFLVQFSMYESSRPFTEHQFMDTIMHTTLPWLVNVIDSHTQKEDEVRLEEEQKRTEERRQGSIAIGFKHSLLQEDAVLSRTRSLVLVGWNNALLWLMDQVCDHVLAAADGNTNMIVRFMETAPKAKEQHQYLVRVGGSGWHNCCESDRTLAITMGEHVADKLAQRPDLLICDSLHAAYCGGFVGRPVAATSGDSHKRFRKWCDHDAVAFIGCIGTDDKETVDVTEPAYEQLRTFSDLRPVSILADAPDLDKTKYRIVVGNHVAVFDVDKGVLDTYGRGNILLPVGVGIET